MSHFPDTSFLYPLYRTDVHSSKVDAFLAAGPGPLRVSTLLLLELRQSTRLQVRLHSANRNLGFPKADADQLLQQVQGDLAQAVLEIASVDWADVHRIAERLSATYTETQGHLPPFLGECQTVTFLMVNACKDRSGRMRQSH